MKEDESNLYLIQVAKVPYSEDFPGYFVKAETQAQVVPLPPPPDNL